MRKWKTRLALALPVLILALPALAQGDPNAARGVVDEHCVACHEVPGYKPDRARPTLEAPAFQEIADDAETYNRARLEAFLRRPHHPVGVAVRGHDRDDGVGRHLPDAAGGGQAVLPGHLDVHHDDVR